MEVPQSITHTSAQVNQGIPAAPGFLLKLHSILETPGFDHIISWSSDGMALVIKNSTDFAQQVLPRFFKHANLSSFIRQLNLYNFKKTKSKVFEYVFSHDQFQLNKKHLLVHIKRKTPDLAPVFVKSKVNTSNTEANHPDILYQENVLLKRIQKELMTKMKDLEVKVGALYKTNQDMTAQFQKACPPQRSMPVSLQGTQEPLKMPHINAQIMNEAQKTPIFGQNTLMMQQTGGFSLPFAQNHQVLAPGQFSHMNLAPNFQHLQMFPQEGMMPLFVNPQPFQPNILPSFPCQDSLKMHFASNTSYKDQVNHSQPLILIPSGMTHSTNSIVQFSRENSYGNRDMPNYCGKISDKFDNYAEGVQMVRLA